MRRENPPGLFSREVRSLHCVGVGGMGLGPLAVYLAGRGWTVSGEDDVSVAAMKPHLDLAGVRLTGCGEVPADCGLLVVSSAIPADHPSVTAARARGIQVARRGEVLAEVARERKLVAVCGSHGKTTTTAMIIAALRAAGFPAGYVLGGLFADDAVPPARVGSNDWLVAEIDESDGTIDRFSPELTVTVNLDWDHPDHYRRPDDLEAAFAALFARTAGTVLVNDACAFSARVAARLGAGGPALLTFGRTGDFLGEPRDERETGVEVALAGRFPQAKAKVRALGGFNAVNATAALAALRCMGVDADPSDLLAAYPGVRRRQAVLHDADGLTVVEDYAHHPAEIRALLGSLRQRTGGRLVAVFQPHRFSRTAQFKAEFAAALAQADEVHLIDVYGAGEPPLAGGTTADLYAELRRAAPALPVAYLPGAPGTLLDRLALSLKPGAWVAFVGAGDIDLMARDWLTRVRELAGRARRWDEFAAALSADLTDGTEVRREESLARKTTIQLGGAARLYAEPLSIGGLQALVRGARRLGVPLFVLGRGSNLIVPDEGVDGLVVSLRQEAFEKFTPLPDGRVRVGAGLRLKNLCGKAQLAGLVGFEFLEGIPGNVGGALRMNAGAMDGWMFDVVETVDLVTMDGLLRTLRKDEMHVDYRHCAELHDAIAVGAVIRPAGTAAPAEVEARIKAFTERRKKSQPRESSAGCIFKNPPGDAAGRLIDASGLKGERVGGAEVSPVHANFIVNHGGASATDVIALVRRVRARVEEATGVRLEPEVLLYGREWKDVL